MHFLFIIYSTALINFLSQISIVGILCRIFCVVIGILCSTLKNIPFTVVGRKCLLLLGRKCLLSIFFSCYYQAFPLKLELIGIDLFPAGKRIDYD